MESQLLFALFRRLFPLPDGYAESGKPYEELLPVYRNWELLSLPLMLVLVPPLTCIWWLLLYQLSLFIAGFYRDAVFHLYPPGIVWLLPAMLLGILSTGPFLVAIRRRRLKDRYREYVRYGNLKHRFDQDRAMPPFFVAAVLLVLLGVAALMHWRVVFTQREIITCPFFGLSNVRHSYDDIVEIRTAPVSRAPSGKVVPNEAGDHVVDFSDGSVWSTYPIWSHLRKAEKHELIDFIVAKSGKQVRQVPILNK